MMRALDLAEAVDAGDLTPATILELAIEAISDREDEIRAFAALDLDLARIKAARIASQGGFFGLPIGVKDIIDTAEFPTAHGSAIYAGHRPKADASIVCLIDKAEGYVLGKTATTEFAYLNPAPTFNPHNPAHTPGGSSAGSAAGVAAGFMPLALGTQTGGSVIRPASFCGVAAIKPSYRLLPMQGVKPFAPLLDTMGLFGARVVDIAFGLEVLSERPMRVDGRDFGLPRIGVTRLPFAGAVDQGCEMAIRMAISAFERLGAPIGECDLPKVFADAHAAHGLINDREGATSLMWEYTYHKDAISPILAKALDAGRAVSVEEFDKARSLANKARKAAHALFEEIDVLLTFSAPGLAPARDSTGEARFNRLFTLLGLPCVNVPVWRDPATGLPVGIQIVGAFGDDHRTLAAAAMLEAALAAP
ncbi:GatA Asp-tRNAAsn/Glu-tRNAGln amidotransferase A subunit and related amidases [Rhabdaerophilaceae bacterium]